MLLTMTRRTVLPIAALMHISMAVRAALPNTDEPRLTSRQNAGVGVGVTLFTSRGGMNSLQMKLKALVLKKMCGQVIQGNGVSGKYHDTLAEVSELPHIARPVVPF